MGTLLFLNNLGTSEVLIITIVIILFFGGKKIPELMRGLGKGIKSFNDEMKDIEIDIKTNTSEKKSEKISD